MNQRLTSYFGLLFADPKESILRLLAQLIIFCAAMGISLPGIQTRAAELPTIEVGLPEDGLFGLGGQYIIDKGLDRKNGFVMKPRWAGVPEIQRLLGIQALSVGLMTPEAALRANVSGVPIRLIQPYQTSHMFVVVRKESPYRASMTLKARPSP